MIRRIFFLLISILCSAYSFAQKSSISGRITDNENKPLFGASIGVLGKPYGTTTDDDGRYDLEVAPNQNLKVVISFTGFKTDTVNIFLKADQGMEISRKLSLRENAIPQIEIYDESNKGTRVTKIDPTIIRYIPGPDVSVEGLIKRIGLGVSGVNELSSQYSVRGGNYDENLVYINDFEVYRPLLVRSGQQEGLSVINPDMVDEINFSGGGFEAAYGDKLSSVLDIKYRKPKKFAGVVSLSLLGASLELENQSKNKKLYYMIGVRQKSNEYVLNSLETKGEYKPSFTDLQLVTGYKFSEKFSTEIFANYSRNKYRLVPTNRETNFGTINDAKRFTVYFEGEEADKYEAATGALSFSYLPNNNLKLKLITSAYTTDETENFDLLGQYFLDQLEADLGKETFGDIAFNLGVGSFLNHARNNLQAEIYSAEHKGELIGKKTVLEWGLRAQHENIDDKLHEWYYNDSSGYSIPSYRDSINPQIMLNDVVVSKNTLSSNRYSGYLQNTWEISDSSKWLITAGIRFNYWDLNKQTVVSPRAQIIYKPHWNRKLNLRLSGGYYFQPPFYREIRDLDGTLYPETKAQESIHIVAGGDYRFLAVSRNFKLTVEAYYKFLVDMIPYKVNDIRIRYLPQYRSEGYARGIDMKLYGEFVPGTESWVGISYLQTEEDVIGDKYYVYYNEAGEEIIKGYTFDQRPADSTMVEPGYIPRPTDQRINFVLFFQDYLPKSPTYKMYLSLYFGTSLPFGPPGKERYNDVLRTPTYRRVDIGFSKQLIGEDVKKKPRGKFLNTFNSVWFGLEVFNLLQVNNVASYTWITDVSNARKYAVPNYLTGRQLNVKLIVKF